MPGNIVGFLGRNLLAICVIGGGSLALTHVANHPAHGDREFEPENEADRGTITRTELLKIWLPATLVELSRRQTGPAPIRTHQELQAILDARRHRDLWYARTLRAHQVNGQYADVTFIRWPYSDSWHFAELIDVLAVVAGEPTSDPAFADSDPRVSVIPDRLLHRDPREVIGEALARERE